MIRLRHLTVCLLAAIPVLTAGAVAAAPPRPETATPTAQDTTIRVTISLKGRDDPGLRGYAASVSTPGDTHHHRFLTTTELRRRFGAPTDALDRIAGWARTAGRRVGAVDATGTRLPVTANAATIERALGVQLYDTVQDGIRVRTATPVRLPAPVAAAITAITGLAEQPALPMHHQPATAQRTPRGSCLRPPAGGEAAALSCLALPAGTIAEPGITRPIVPLTGPGLHTVPGPNPQLASSGSCAAAWAIPDLAPVQSRPPGRVSVPLCGYTASQLRSLYGLPAAGNAAAAGSGQTVVVVGAFNHLAALRDANTAFRVTGVAPLPAGRYQVTTYDVGEGLAQGCDEQAWHLHQAVAVQTIHTLAPAARIVYAAAPDCTRLTDTLAHVVADPALRGAVVSIGWGYPAEALSDDELAATDAVLARAAVLGTGTYSASGMYGTAAPAGMLLPDRVYPASSPWTTAVGGTTSAVGAADRVLWQTGWAGTATPLTTVITGGRTSESAQVTVAAGGGFSRREPRPAWQPATAGEMRLVPDLAALADPNTGALIGSSTADGRYGLGPVGGTGLAAPIVAGLAALGQARCGHPAGLITPRLWQPGAAVVSDVHHVNAALWTPQVPCLPARATGYLERTDSTPEHAGPGWDPITGFGTPARAFRSDVC